MKKSANPELTKETEDQLNELTCVARGNVDLVEEALLASIKYTRSWKQFFRKKEYLDVEAAARYIREKVKQLDEVPMETHDGL